jgi:hypothetical protein
MNLSSLKAGNGAFSIDYYYPTTCDILLPIENDPKREDTAGSVPAKAPLPKIGRASEPHVGPQLRPRHRGPTNCRAVIIAELWLGMEPDRFLHALVCQVENVTITHGASTLASWGILLEVIKSPLSEHRIGCAPRRIARWARECSCRRISFLNLCITTGMIVLGPDLDRILPHRLL